LNRRIFTGSIAQFASLLAVLGTSLALPAHAQQSKTPTAATSAVVNSESVTVFSEMDASGEHASTLQKGASVYVDLRMDQGGRSWCGVRPSQQAHRIGFVDCKLLLRVGNVPSGAGANLASPSSSRTASAEIPLLHPAAPTTREYAAIKDLVIKEDVIDSGYVATLDGQAAGGAPSAVTRAALAHLAAGEFELAQREPDKATEQFQAMQSLAGQQRNLLLASLEGQAFAMLMKSEYSSALELSEKARKLNPKSARLASLSGWARYRLNQLDAAIADLQLSQKLQPSANVAALLEQATRDKETEGDFGEGESRHFVIRYHGGASRQLAAELIRVLEEHFQALAGELHFTPAEPITVIVYTRETFREVTGVPDWAGAANDGRIRVPVQGLETVPEALSRSLKHELTHSFLYQKTQGRCPTWLQEGVAQWMSGRRVGRDAAQVLSIFQNGQGKPLRSLDGNWMKFSSAESWFSYQWSLAAVEGIEADSGSDGLDRLLDAERTESSGEAALLQGLRTNYSSLDEATIAYLRRTYLQ
jgi:tetratricopeptide (TPR) repeat protein